jgi:Domain of unknown function (DUF4340)
MSTKQLQAIAVAVALLLLVWGGSEIWSRKAGAPAPTLRLPLLSASAVDTVAITHGADTVVLVKHAPGAWTVNRHPATQTSINDLFTALRDSVRAELAAESPSSFARMGVDSGGGRLVRVVGAGKTLAQLLVGGTGAGFDGAYVRIPGETRVYLWRGPLPTLVARAADDWREHQIGAVAPESIAVVAIERAGKRTTLHRRGTTWELSPTEHADSAAVAQFLEHLRKVSASGFATDRQADSISFARPARRVIVQGSGARPLLALAFDSTAGGFWARTPEGGTVYRLEFWAVDQLTPTRDALKKHP